MKKKLYKVFNDMGAIYKLYLPASAKQLEHNPDDPIYYMCRYHTEIVLCFDNGKYKALVTTKIDKSPKIITANNLVALKTKIDLL